MSPESGETGRAVFISYRRLDNDPPPDGPKDRGFVDYLLRNVRYDLTQLGVTNLIFWQDRSKIAPADDFPDEISNALNNADLFIAIVSRNYITSTWCAKELDTMTARIRVLGAPAEEHRIFRVDKHKILDDEVPEPLRRIESVRFYREDRYADRVDDYFWRGIFAKGEIPSTVGDRRFSAKTITNVVLVPPADHEVVRSKGIKNILSELYERNNDNARSVLKSQLLPSKLRHPFGTGGASALPFLVDRANAVDLAIGKLVTPATTFSPIV